MEAPHSFSHWKNLPFFVAEAFPLTTCTWHIGPKIYILSPKNQRTLSDSLPCLDQHELLVHDTNVLSTQQFCRILLTTLDVASHLPVLTYESFAELLIFLHHQWMDLTLLCFCMTLSVFFFPRWLILLRCPLWADLIISFSAIFISSKSNTTLCYFVWSNSLAHLFRLMQSNSFFLKHITRSMVHFNLGQLEILSSKPAMMSSCMYKCSSRFSFSSQLRVICKYLYFSTFNTRPIVFAEILRKRPLAKKYFAVERLCMWPISGSEPVDMIYVIT